MSKQPEALELADLLNKKDFALHRQSANELRRLHEEVKCEERRFNGLWEKFAALDKTNQELVEALKEIASWTERYTTPGHPVSMVARKAIAKATGESA